MTKEQILAAVDELVGLARKEEMARHMYDTCAHNQDYLRLKDAEAAYLTARGKLEKELV